MRTDDSLVLPIRRCLINPPRNNSFLRTEEFPPTLRGIEQVGVHVFAASLAVDDDRLQRLRIINRQRSAVSEAVLEIMFKSAVLEASVKNSNFVSRSNIFSKGDPGEQEYNKCSCSDTIHRAREP